MKDKIVIKGARQHNLKNVDLEIPKNKLVVFTGVSGSGKSSLAYDTIYAEGQRRYVESLSTYARQFLGIMEKPDVDLIEGLSPSISIDQKAASKNPRSTVGTVTEIYDYLRLLFARVGHPHCPICGKEITTQSHDQIATSSLDLIKKIARQEKFAKLMILSPVVRGKKGEFSSLMQNLRAKGYKQVRIDGQVRDLAGDLVLIKTNKHHIDVVIDRLIVNYKNLKDETFLSNLKSRLSNSIEQALKLSDGLAILTRIKDASFEMPQYPKKFKDHLFSERFTCPADNIQIPEIEPRTFSFNSPHGACPTCSGIGEILKIEAKLLFSEELSITEGGILPFKNMFEHDTWYTRLIFKVCEEHGIDPRVSIGNYSKEQKNLILYGTGGKQYRVEGSNRFGRDTHIFETFTGIVSELERRYKNTKSSWVRHEIEKYMRDQVCQTCQGKRLKSEALNVTIKNLAISDVTDFSITNALLWIDELTGNSSPFSKREAEIANLILKEIRTRLLFLRSVGLEYLTLSRQAASLSSGESQRIRLASQIGTGLTGVLYVLDEPTIGLHMRDNQKLIDTLKNLRDLGNTVIVVEHDKEMIRQSDFVIDFGPRAGKQGGLVVASGPPKEISRNKKSLTGNFLSGARKVKASFATPKIKGDASRSEIKISGCSQHNLKNLTIKLPLNKLIVITGVSGSGKSTLLVETLYPAIMSELNPLFKGEVGKHNKLEGLENIDKARLINQSPIGRTPRSNPATYTKMFDHIRDVFANTREAKAAGFKKGRFSFNLKGGRCEACEGQGQNKIEMQFMSDIWVTCEVCRGQRYNAQTLGIEYRGKNIAEVLKMTVNEAIDFFHAHHNIVSKLDTLQAVGLGYIELGQPATTLSGGEAQRIKLSAELAKRNSGKTVYILDEPTTGLHFADIEKLLRVLKMLVHKGNTVIIIEHNIDVIKNADWIIDLGPEGGELGGEVVVEGEVATIKKNKRSYTGKFL